MNGQDAVVLVGKPELGASQAAFYVTEAETLPLDSEYTFLYRGDGTVDVNLRYGDFEWGWQCCHLTLNPGQPLPEPGTPEGRFQPGYRQQAACPAIARQPELPDALAEPGEDQ